MLSELLSFISNFASSMGTTQLGIILIILVIFIAFLVLMKKVVKTILNVIWIGFASAAFPFFMNLVFGFDMPINIDTILFFVIFGLGLYFIYILGKIIYTVLGLAEKSAKVVSYPITARSKHKKEEMEEKMERLVEKGEREEKERKKAEKEAKKKEQK